MRAKPPRDAGPAGGVAAIPAPPVELDTVATGRAIRRGRGNRVAAFVSSRWVATSAALILITATAALVRFAGLSRSSRTLLQAMRPSLRMAVP